MSAVSGWYYDYQTDYEEPSGRLTCITLHPSTKASDAIEWPADPGDPDQGFYSKNPIAVALINEDFQVSIANSWSEFGGDPLGQMWDSIRPLAPYAGFAEDMIRKADDNYLTARSEGRITNENKFSKAVGDFFHKFRTKMDSLETKAGGGVSSYLSMALVTMGTRFSYYAGTGISFGSMVMKYYVMPQWNGTSFITVTKQLEDLYPFIVGHLRLKEQKANDPDKLIAWQQAPGGFKSDYRDVDTEQKGTLLLKYGGLYAVNNLVVEQANLVFSKQSVKHPIPSITGQNYSPLYCEVTLQLKPASKFSDNKLKDFVNNKVYLPTTHDKITGKLIR